jgi:parallel beta-helix repeat protein
LGRILAAIVGLAALALPVQAAVTTTTLVPTSYVTTQGSDGKQPVAHLDVLDEDGVVFNPLKYVQFNAKTSATTYAGYRTYTLPTSIAAASITSIMVQANYEGPARAAQAWTWQIFDWVNNGYVTVGDNYMAPSHGPRTILSFNIGGNNLANYVRASDRQIRLQLLSNKSADNALLDYEALVVTSTSVSARAPVSYFVSTMGNDGNPGTFTQPWRHIQRAACTTAACKLASGIRVVGPGSTVYVRGGVYHEQVTVYVSGSAAGGYIQFQSYPGETTVIDGTGVPMPPSDTVPIGLFELSNSNYVIIEGFEIRNWTGNSSSVFPAGVAITGKGSNVQVLHNKVHGIVNNFCATNTCCTDGSCNGGAHGIAAYGTLAPSAAGPKPISNLVIDGNEVYGLITGQSESMPVNGNVDGWSITNNVVHDNNNIGIDAIGFECVVQCSTLDQARHGYIAGNLVYNCSDAKNPAYPADSRNGANGIYVDGGTHITIERNTVHHNNVGIELASEINTHVTSYVTARDNLIYLNTAPGIAIGGHDLPGTDPNNPDCCGSTDHCTIVNNTLYQNDSTPSDGSGEFIINYFPTNVSGNVFENNIVRANSQGVLVNNAFANPVVKLDYNLYYAPSGNPMWVWKNVCYNSLSTYQANSGNDFDSPFSDPMFLNPGALVFWLQPTSFAVDGGVNLAAAVLGTLDLAGFARLQGTQVDIGAYQQ